MNYKSQLGYIMDLLEVTGKDLALAINVDRTLVSKWKNNARPFSSASTHFINLIEALIFFNIKRKDSTLERFFGKIYPNEDKNEPEYLEVCLALWLIGKDLGSFNNLNDWRASKTALYSTQVEVYQGNAGKRNAIIDFFDYALTLPAGQEIFISDVESTEWLLEDNHYRVLYFSKFHEMIEKGHNITIIYNLDIFDSFSDENILDRLKIYYGGHVTSYYATSEKPTNRDASLYIIHRHMTLKSMCVDNESHNRYIAVHRDPFTIQYMVSIFVERMKESVPMISTFSSKGSNLKGFLSDITDTKLLCNTCYLAPQSPLAVISSETLAVILKYNNVPPHFLEFLEMVRQQNHHLLMKNVETSDVDLILSKEVLIASLKEEENLLREISSICRLDIYSNPDINRLIYNDIVKLVDTHHNFNVTIMAFDEHPFLYEIAFWLFEDLKMYSMKLVNGQNFVVSNAPRILSLAAELIHEILMENEDEQKLNTYI